MSRGAVTAEAGKTFAQQDIALRIWAKGVLESANRLCALCLRWFCG